MSRFFDFLSTVLSPPTPRPKRAPFFEDGGSDASPPGSASLRKSQRTEDRQSPAPPSPLTPAPGVGPLRLSFNSPAPIDLTQDSPLPERSFLSPAKRRRSGAGAGPLEELKRRAEQERYQHAVDMSVHGTPSAEPSLSGDAASEASFVLPNSSIFRSPAAASAADVSRVGADDELGSVVPADRYSRALDFLQREKDLTVDALTIGAKQNVEHQATLYKLRQEEFAHRSTSDTARAEVRTQERRRSVGHTNVAERPLEPLPLPKPASTATTEHLFSPRSNSHAFLEMRLRIHDEEAKRRTAAIDAMTAKLEMLRRSREQRSHEEIQKRVDERIAEARKKKDAEAADLKELTAEEDGRVDKAMRSGDDVKLASAFNLDVCGRDAKTLAPQQWLNDEVINFYMQLLKERETKSGGALPKCHFFNSFFYAKLVGERQDKYDYSGVRRWTTRASVDIFAMDKVIMPIHLPVHWCCAVINVKEKRFEYYDSLGGENPTCLKALRRYLVDEYADKKKGTLSLDGWTDYTPKNIPMQQNGYDCGVFCVKFADYCARDQPFLFTQKDMPKIRRRLLLNLLNKKAD